MRLNGKDLFDIWQSILFAQELGIDPDSILMDMGVCEVNQ
jgi:hypothetical protein